MFSNDMKNLNNETRNGFNLTFVNTYYSYPQYKGSKHLIQIINSNALFINTTIRNVNAHNVSLVSAGLTSKLQFMKCDISNITLDLAVPIVSIFNFSVLYIVECTFENNEAHTLFHSQEYCENIIHRSIFTKNRTPNNNHGPCFAVLNNTKVQIFNTTFHKNEMQFLWGEFYIDVNISNSKYVQNVIKSKALISLYYRCHLTIEHGNFISNLAESQPVSLNVNYYTTLTVRNSLFFNNSGGTSASLLVSDSSAYIDNVSFESNSGIQGSCISVISRGKVHVRYSTFSGGVFGPAVYASPGGDLTFEKCTFINQSSPADSFMKIQNSKLKMIDCTIDNNKMGITGGIAQATKSIITVQKCEFRKNKGRYGTLFSLSRMSIMTIEDSTFQHNTGSMGGCIFFKDSTIQISTTIFDNNKAVVQGGAIAGERCNLTVRNSNFTNHIAGLGGVIYMMNGTLMAQSSIFENNTTPDSVGAVIYKMFSGELTLDNCLLSMNSGPKGAIWHYYYNNSILRFSNTKCVSCKDCGPCSFMVVNGGYKLTVFSWKFEIELGEIHISSTEPDFVCRAVKKNLINAEQSKIYWKEIPFASGKAITYLLFFELEKELCH